MKTAEYLSKHVNGRKINYEGIMADLKAEFVESVRDITDYPQFQKAITDLKTKFTNISNKLPGVGLHEKSWGYLYGKVICATRDEMFEDEE